MMEFDAAEIMAASCMVVGFSLVAVGLWQIFLGSHVRRPNGFILIILGAATLATPAWSLAILPLVTDSSW